jgi:copper chaperone
MESIKTTLHVEGMSCRHCVMAIEKAVSALAGVKAVKVDLDAKSVNVEFDPGKVTLDSIGKAITGEGYTVVQ